MASQCFMHYAPPQSPLQWTVSSHCACAEVTQEDSSKTNRMARMKSRNRNMAAAGGNLKLAKVTSIFTAAISDDIISKQQEEAGASCVSISGVSISGVSISGADSEQLPAAVGVSPGNISEAAAACRRRY